MREVLRRIAGHDEHACRSPRARASRAARSGRSGAKSIARRCGIARGTALARVRAGVPAPQREAQQVGHVHGVDGREALARRCAARRRATRAIAGHQLDRDLVSCDARVATPRGGVTYGRSASNRRGGSTVIELTRHDAVFVLQHARRREPLPPRVPRRARTRARRGRERPTAPPRSSRSATASSTRTGSRSTRSRARAAPRSAPTSTRVHRLFARVLAFPRITVAAINGHAFAGGGMLALAHDFRVMRSDRGYFCLPESRPAPAAAARHDGADRARACRRRPRTRRS